MPVSAFASLPPPAPPTEPAGPPNLPTLVVYYTYCSPTYLPTCYTTTIGLNLPATQPTYLLTYLPPSLQRLAALHSWHTGERAAAHARLARNNRYPTRPTTRTSLNLPTRLARSRRRPLILLLEYSATRTPLNLPVRPTSNRSRRCAAASPVYGWRLRRAVTKLTS